jgi:hypothetical protein
VLSRLLRVICVLTFLASPLAAQAPRQVRITATTANVRQGPGTNQEILGTVASGTILEVVRDAGPWYEVRLSQELGFKVRSGYVHSSTAEPVRVVARPQPPPAPAVIPQSAPVTVNREPQSARPQTGPGYKDPTIGLLISIVIPGGGHLYAGETKKGGILLGTALGGTILGTAFAVGAAENGSAGGVSAALLVGWGLYLGSWIYGIVDSQDAVRRHNASLGYGYIDRITPIVSPGQRGTPTQLGLRFGM